MIARILAGLLVTAGAAAVAASDGPTHDAAKGGRDFVALGCAECHGTTGAGGGWQGPRLAPFPIPYTAFLRQLRDPADKMPRYSHAVLSDAEAADLYAYLRGIKPGQAASDIAILNRR